MIMKFTQRISDSARKQVTNNLQQAYGGGGGLNASESFLQWFETTTTDAALNVDEDQLKQFRKKRAKYR